MTEHDHQCVDIIVGDVKTAACGRRVKYFRGMRNGGASRNNMRDAHVVEEPLSLFQIFGEIANGYDCEIETRRGVS